MVRALDSGRVSIVDVQRWCLRGIDICILCSTKPESKIALMLILSLSITSLLSYVHFDIRFPAETSPSS